ncbi:MAG: type II toxin-antitoxin system VapC family toxin, partial [Acidimicrobiales bacterium]
ETLHALHLLAVEVAQAVRRYVASGDLIAVRSTAALSDLADLDIVHHPHEPLLPTMWRLRSNLTSYDAAYVALAFDAPLVTLDARIAAAPEHGATVDLIA